MQEVKIVSEKTVDVGMLEREMQDVSEMFFLPVGKSLSLPRSSVRVSQPNIIRNHGCVMPPYNAAHILAYKELDATYQTCLDIKADAVVGLGHYFGFKDIEKYPEVANLFQIPNDKFEDTMTTILKAAYMDYQLFDNCYLEFVKSGNMRSLYYLEAKDMYIRPVGNTNMVDKYMFIPSGARDAIVYEPFPVDSATKDGVHYCIHIKKPAQNNLYYGNPDTKHLFDLIKISYLSDQYNINFFSNGGQPAWAVLITGGKMSKRSYEKTQEFIRDNLQGVQNSHKMLFLSVPGERATIKLVPLSKSIDEQFITLNDKVQFKIALKCRVHPKLLGLSTGGNFGGGSSGITDLKLFMETNVNAEQNSFAEFINKFLLLEFGINCEFGFKKMKITNEKDDAIIANIYFNMVDEYGNRVIGVNEVRQRMGLKPIDLNETPVDESQDGNMQVTITEEGELDTSDHSTMNIGDGQASDNFDPDKNNDEGI